MSIAISAESFSSAGFESLTPEYINKNRGVDDLGSILFENVYDFTVANDSIYLLTAPIALSAVFDTPSLTSNGFDIVDYYYDPTDQENLTNLTISTRSPIPTSQYLVSMPLETLEGSSIDFNVMGLKTYKTPAYNFDYSKENFNSRIYSTLNFPPKHLQGIEEPKLCYSSEVVDYLFPADQKTLFYPIATPKSGLSATNIEDYNFIEFGAIGGSSPQNSDQILVEQYGYPTHTNSGADAARNGELLCVWLSADSLDVTANYAWMERWFDPDTAGALGDAVISSKTSGSCSKGIWDIPTSESITPKQKFIYNRMGLNRHLACIEAEADNLLFSIDQWTTNLTNDGGFLGELVNYEFENSEVFELDGTTYGYIPIQNEFIVNDEISISVDAYKDDWLEGKTVQLFGNFYEGGLGIFYDTGIGSPIITIGGNNGKVYSLNEDLIRIFEKDIMTTAALSSVSDIDYVVTDSENSRWLYDSANNKILKLDIDDIFLESISLSSNSNIKKMEIDSHDQLYVLDDANDELTVYDKNAVFVSSLSTTDTMFTLDNDDNVITTIANYFDIDSEGTLYKVISQNLYKKESGGEWLSLFHFPSKVTDLKLDSDDNVYVVYDGNKIIKIGKDERIKFHKELFDTSKLEKESVLRVGLIKRVVDNIDTTFVIVLFGNYEFIVILDSNGNIVGRKKFRNILITDRCRTNGIDAIGDFTGYNVSRKTKKMFNGEGISTSNPAITYKIYLKDQDGLTQKYEYSTPAKHLYSGWHVFGMSYDRSESKISYFLDGRLLASESLTRSTSLDFNTSSPFLIGANSGKIGTENDERELVGKQFFVGKIDHAVLYTKAYDEFFMNSLAERRLNRSSDMYWVANSDETSYVEEIDSFFFNRRNLPKTNNFNLNIRNSGITDPALREYIEESIRASIKRVKPVNTELLGINWIDRDIG
jgi:hypothetical protein